MKADVTLLVEGFQKAADSPNCPFGSAEVTGLERHAPSRRLPELREERLVRCGEPRTCRVTGTRCITWWPAGA